MALRASRPVPTQTIPGSTATRLQRAPTASIRGLDGTVITWQRGEPLVAGVERLLIFTATNADGTPAALEPYMGMIGHVAVANAEGTVFAHLHPSGSIAMAALQKFAGAADPHAQHQAMTGNQLSIPVRVSPGREVSAVDTGETRWARCDLRVRRSRRSSVGSRQSVAAVTGDWLTTATEDCD